MAAARALWPVIPGKGGACSVTGSCWSTMRGNWPLMAALSPLAPRALSPRPPEPGEVAISEEQVMTVTITAQAQENRDYVRRLLREIGS
jgi:hypothetical protein